LSVVHSHQENLEPRPVTEPGDRALAAWEIASVVSSIIITEWIVSSVSGGNKFIATAPVTLAFALMILSHRLRKETLRDIGFRFDNVPQAALLLLFPMLLATILCWVIGHWFGGQADFQRWHAGKSIVVQLILAFGWGVLQQYVLQGFINQRAQMIWGRGWISVLLVAALFAGLHLPNLWLTVATFGGGLVWAAIYQRAPNIFALALSHSLMTWVLVSTLPASALDHLRIGFKYFG
jgi:membrane protease YdiL (CAAX protease family)